jgi:hypothetical protein
VLIAMALTMAVIILFGLIHDWWGIEIMSMLMIARLINMVVIKRRTTLGWKGASEPGVQCDLLVLLSQDRWVRMRGLVNDLKEVTSGRWLRDQSTVKGFATGFATLLVYSAAALGTNLSTIGGLFLALQLLLSAAILGLCNSCTNGLRMYDCVLAVEGEPQHYKRRLDMANELIKQSGRSDWAVGMGLILPIPNQNEGSQTSRGIQTVSTRVVL